MFDTFGGFDDEGYLLITLKAFARHGGLYTHVYSAFGPFYFEAFSTIFTWLPVTLDNGRMVTTVVTLLASLGFGVGITMLTRSALAGLSTQVGTFILLPISFAKESMHPLILVWLTFAVAIIALALIARGQRSIGFLVLGATLAALVLTVVNVGAFATIALLFTGFLLAPPIWKVRLPRLAAAVLFIASPFLLIVVAGGHATDTWAVKYACIVALAAAAVVVVTLDGGLQGLVQGRDALRFLLGAGILGALVVVIALVTGTHPVDLVRGVFIDPAHFSSAYDIRIILPVWVEAWGAACVAGAFAYRHYRKRNPNAQMGSIEACAHIAAGLLILYCAISQGQIRPPFSVTFTVALPLVFFVAIPPTWASESERVARVALASLAVLEGLLAYPVAGAQVWWSSLLLVPAGMLCLHDGVRQVHVLGSLHRHTRRVATDLLVPIVVSAGVAWLSWVFVGNLSVESSDYYSRTPVTLPGSDLIRLPVHLATALESLSHAISAQCSSFVTFPDLNSFYFWTGESPPTDWFNVWFYTLDAHLQKQIARNIEGPDRSRFCVVDSPRWSRYWAQGHVLPQLPLAREVEKFRREHSPPELFGGYRLFVSPRAPS